MDSSPSAFGKIVPYLKHPFVLVGFMIFLSTSFLTAVDAAGPSFDCKKARGWSEKAVCNDSTLADLDVQVTSLYRGVRAQLTDAQRKELKNDQRTWLRQREGCKGNSDEKDCLLGVYNTRIAQLGVAVPAGQEPSATGDIKSVDFRNFSYDLGKTWCAKEVGNSTVEMRDGEYGDFRDTGFSISADRIVYGDLTGDGHDEAVVITYCGGMHPEEQAFVYAMKEGRALLLTKLEPGSRANGGIVRPHLCQGCSDGIAIQGGVVTVERMHGKAACCPEYVEKKTYRWIGQHLVQVGEGQRRKFEEASAQGTVAASSGPADASTLTVEGKTVTYWPSTEADLPPIAGFSFESNGYSNVYTLDCQGKRFIWSANLSLSTGETTGNSAGAEWTPLNPKSTISNAVYEAFCPQLLDVAQERERMSIVPLLESCRHDITHCTVERVEQLIQAGADPNESGLPLKLALIYGLSTDVLRALIEAGADVTATDSSGFTLVHSAVRGNGSQQKIEQLRLLLEAGVDPNAADTEGLTPLMYVAIDGIDVEAAKRLIDAGADPTLELPEKASFPGTLPLVSGDTAFDIARKKLKQIEDYQKKNPPPTDAMRIAQQNVAEGAAQVLQLLQERTPESTAPAVAATSPPQIARTNEPLRSEEGDKEPERRASSVAAEATQTDRIEVKDGSTLTGKLVGGKVPFKSSFGEIEVSVDEVEGFADGKLRLSDRSVLNGQFGEKEIEITTSRGDLTIQMQDIVNIERVSGDRSAAKVSAQEPPEEVTDSDIEALLWREYGSGRCCVTHDCGGGLGQTKSADSIEFVARAPSIPMGGLGGYRESVPRKVRMKGTCLKGGRYDVVLNCNFLVDVYGEITLERCGDD